MIAGIIALLFLSALFICSISLFIYDVINGHSWDYRNPFDRTCKKCGRHEVSHCWSMSTWNKAWWEVFNDGDAGEHKHRKAKLWIASFIGIALYALIILSAVYK